MMKRLTSLRRIGLAAAGAVLLAQLASGGLPEPGITVFGKLWDSGTLITSGDITLTFTPQGGGSPIVKTTQLASLLDGNGNTYSYALYFPMESPLTGMTITANSFELPATPKTYTRTVSVNSLPITLPAGQNTSIVNDNSRGLVQRLDFNLGPLPSGDGTGDGELTPGDAQYAFDAFLNNDFFNFLNPDQQAALDVTCDGQVTPLDAQWIFEAYLHIRTLVPCPSPKTNEANATPPQLEVANVAGPAGSTVAVPIFINTTNDVEAFGLSLNFDPSKLEFDSVTPANPLTQNWVSVSGHLEGSGEVVVGGFRGAAPAATGVGKLFIAQMKIKPGAEGFTPIVITQTLDHVANASVIEGGVAIGEAQNAATDWKRYE